MDRIKLAMKKTNYFSHDSNARNDSKIIPLRMKLGSEGYGIYFMIIERLREETNYTCLKDYDGLAFDFRTTKEKIKSVIEDFDLFEFTDDGYFYSKSLKQRMLIKDEKSKRRSEAGVLGNEKRWKKSEKTPIENQPVIAKVSQCDENSSQVKESKVKESKVNNTPNPFKGEIQVSENSEEEKKDDLIKTPEEKKEEKSSAKKEELIFNFPLKDNAFFSDEEFYNLPSFIQQSKDMLLEWGEYKKQAKKTYTKMGAIKLFSRINNFFNNNTQRLQAAIDFSMASNYQGIYEGHNTRQNGNIRHQEVTKLPDPDEYGEGTL